MTDVEQRIECRWCHAQSPSTARSCDRCGAPLDVRDTVTDSGWRQAPRLRDLTELHWSGSTLQVDTGVVPVVEIDLGTGDSVFFEHYAMLWKDETVPMSVLNMPGGAKRLLSGMPFVLSVAHGKGRAAFSRDAPGEVVVIPIDAPAEVDVREHALVLATTTLSYSFEKLPGIRAMIVSGTGMYLDRYAAQGGPGLLVLHGYGNVFQRSLAEGETILIEPGAFLYKDSPVTIEVISISFKGQPAEAPPAAQETEAAPEGQGGGGLFGRGLKGLKAAKSMINVGGLAQAAGNLRSGTGIQGVAAGLLGGGGSTLLKMTGPGRVGVQSTFLPHKTE
jgi:uncharacterized protein (AIM24 family)